MDPLNPYPVQLVALASLHPSEQIDSEHAQALAARIRAEGVWRAPIPIDKSGLIMDGNHRARAARLLGLRQVPCVVLEYGDPRVAVRHWDSGDHYDVSGLVAGIVADGRLLPYKTTRHHFSPPLPATEIPLAECGEMVFLSNVI